MQQGSLLVATLESAVVGYAKVAHSEFMGWPLLSIVCVARSSRRPVRRKFHLGLSSNSHHCCFVNFSSQHHSWR